MVFRVANKTHKIIDICKSFHEMFMKKNEKIDALAAAGLDFSNPI